MGYVFRTFPGAIAALFEEQGTSGDPLDINAPRNAPAKTPNSWLHKNKLHTAYDNLEVAFDVTVPYTHPAIGGASTGGVSGGSGATGGGGSENSASIKYGQYANSILLLNHNLGYVPDVAAVVDGMVLYNGMPVQVGASDGRMRCCSIFVTSTQVYLYEHVSAGSATLPAVAKSYRLLVFKQPPAAVGNKLLEYNGAGTTKLAQERFRSDRRYLQVGSDSPFGLAYGKQADFGANGAPRFVNANGSVNDPVPPGLAGRWVVSWATGNVGRTYAPGFGASFAYNGGFGGSGAIQVQPDRPNPVGAAARKGFFFEPAQNRLRMQDNSREVVSTQGNLFNFIRQTHSIGTLNVTFPDVAKSSSYLWTYNVLSNFGTYQNGEWCSSIITANPQTYSQTYGLIGVPTGADFFLGHFYLSRTTAPASTWQGRAIAALPAQGQWFSMFGPTSVLCEAEVGLCRGFHIYISGGTLVLEVQQSVGPAAGGYGSDSGTSGGTPGGVSVTTNSAGGLPVAVVQSLSYGYQGAYTTAAGANAAARLLQPGAAGQCSRSDPTSYYSNWQILGMSVRFGRRS